MPEFNKRVSFRGIRKAEAQFRAYSAKRLGSEKSTDELLRAVSDLERQARQVRGDLERSLRG